MYRLAACSRNHKASVAFFGPFLILFGNSQWMRSNETNGFPCPWQNMLRMWLWWLSPLLARHGCESFVWWKRSSCVFFWPVLLQWSLFRRKIERWIDRSTGHTSEMKDPFPGLWTSRARSIQRKLESIGSQWSGGQNWIRRWLCVWYLLLQLSAIHQVWDSASPLYSKYDYDDKQLLMDRTWKLPILPKSFCGHLGLVPL